MSLTAETEVIKVLKIAQLRKVDICKEDNGISDMQSFVVIQNGDVFECFQSGIDAHPFESLPYVLNNAYNEGVKVFDTVSVVVDSYFAGKSVDKVDDYQRGDLSEQFRNDPNTKVKECLSVMTYGWSGDKAGKVITYAYNDKGLPEFTLVPEAEGGVMSSEFVDFVMNSYIEYCKANPSKEAQ